MMACRRLRMRLYSSLRARPEIAGPCHVLPRALSATSIRYVTHSSSHSHASLMITRSYVYFDLTLADGVTMGSVTRLNVWGPA